MKKISFLMTVYNAEKMLKYSIEGMLNQTYPNIEIVIVNDGSTDSSAEIIKNYCQNNKLIFIDRKENKGRVYSLNEGLSHCTGDWIAVNDADDVSLPSRIEKMIEFINKNGIDKNFGVVGSAYKTVDLVEDKEEIYKIKYFRLGKKQISKFRVYYSMPFAHSTFIYDKAKLLEIGGFATGVTAWIDFFTLNKLSVKYAIYALNEVLVIRYIDGKNYFLSEKMKAQRSHNQKIIEEWKKLNYSQYPIFHFLEKIIYAIKVITQKNKLNDEG